MLAVEYELMQAKEPSYPATHRVMESQGICACRTLPGLPQCETEMAITEASQPSSIESFSYSWPMNLQSSEIGESFRAALDPSNKASFIEMDPRMPPSKRFLPQHPEDFDFDFPPSESSDSVVHADEIFSNGSIMPLFDSMKTETCHRDSVSLPSTPFHSQMPGKMFSADSKLRCSSLKRCRSLSKEMLQKYFDNFLRPIYQKMLRMKLNSKGRGHAALTLKKRSFPGASPQRSGASPCANDWRRFYDSEGSISEAVLHCKRSIGLYREI